MGYKRKEEKTMHGKRAVKMEKENYTSREVEEKKV